MKKIVTCILIFSLITACNTLRDLADVQKPSVRYSSMSFKDISFKDVTLLFNFEVENPNSFGVSADQYQYEFFINGSEFITGTQNENLRIEKESVTTIQVPVSLTFSELYNTIGSVARRDSVSYRLSTEVQFDIAGLTKQRVPVSAEGEMPIPKLPRIELSSFNVKEFSFSGAEMVARFRIENPNSFGITFSDTFYNLEVNGKEWLQTHLEQNIDVNGSGSEIISVPIRLNSSQMGSALIDLLSGQKEFDYHLTGSAQVSADIEGFTGFETIPFDLTGTYRMD